MRAGPRPTHDDYVVQPFLHRALALYAHRDYIARRGQPKGLNLEGHDVIGMPRANGAAPHERWLAEHVAPENCVLRLRQMSATVQAIRLGAGIGFMPCQAAEKEPNLIQIGPALPDWQVPIWLVTHVDLHRTAKVQALLRCLKQVVPASDEA